MNDLSPGIGLNRQEVFRPSLSAPVSVLSFIGRLWSFVPVGGSLPEDVWRRRHRFLLGLTWFHAVAIALAGFVLGYRQEFSVQALVDDEAALHTVSEGLIVALFAFLGAHAKAGRSSKATAVGFGLMTSSAILVHLSGGYIEFHFHFFVMLVFLALYQDWVPYLLAIAYVAGHHGIVGGLWPGSVYNHAAAYNAPWTWAGIHAFFVLSASVGSVIAWRFNELAFARTQLILESAGEGICGLDLEGRVIFINPAATRMLGVGATESIGTRLDAIVRHTPIDGGTFPGGASPIRFSLQDGVPREATDEMFWRRNGSSLPIDYHCAPIVQRGSRVGVVLTFNDVSERKKAEQAIHQLNSELEQKVIERTAELEAANKVKDEFLDIMSHELRTPLTVMMGYMGMIKDGMLGEVNPNQAQALVKAIYQGRNQMSMITGLLQVAQMEAGGAHVNLHRFRLQELLEDLKSGYEFPLDKQVKIVWDYPSELPVVTTDQAKVSHILQNLINNAVKFTEKGSVVVSARCIKDASGRSGKLELKVADTGIGIAQEQLLVIFEKFRQVDGSGTRRHGGVGLGLHIVKQFTALLGGSVDVDSKPGEGSTFSVTIPYQN